VYLSHIIIDFLDYKYLIAIIFHRKGEKNVQVNKLNLEFISDIYSLLVFMRNYEYTQVHRYLYSI